MDPYVKRMFRRKIPTLIFTALLLFICSLMQSCVRRLAVGGMGGGAFRKAFSEGKGNAVYGVTEGSQEGTLRISWTAEHFMRKAWENLRSFPFD